MANITNALGRKSPSVQVFPRPKTMLRAPLTTDMSYPKGQLWIFEDATGTDDIYILSSKRNGSANWLNMGGGGGAFDSLTVAGATTIAGAFTLSALTAGTVVSSAAGLFSVLADGDDGEILIGTTGGAMSWATLTAGAGINIAEAAGAITISNPGATGTTMTASDANVVSPDGAGNTDVIGYDTNITTDGATANTVKIRLADDIVSVASITATNDLTMSAGTCTITSDDNSANAIYLLADAGANEKINIVSTQGTSLDSINVLSTVGGIQLESRIASASSIFIGATNAAGGIDLQAGTGGVAATIVNGDFEIQVGTGNVVMATSAEDHDVTIGGVTGSSAMAFASGTGHTAMTSAGNITIVPAGDVLINTTAGDTYIASTAIAQNVSIATGAAAMAVSIGNTSGASSVVVDVGTGAASFGTSATAHTTTIGSTNTTSSTVIQSGSGNVVVTSTDDITIDAAGLLELNSSAGVIGIASDADAFDVNISTGASERITTIGNITAASSVVLNVGTGNCDVAVGATNHTTRLGSTSGTCDTTIQSGSGSMLFSAGGVFDVNATGAITIDGATATVTASADSAQAIYLHTNAGTSETIDIVNTQGTNAAAIALTSTAGGVTVTGSAITLAAAGDVDIQPGTNSAAAAAITLNSKVGVCTFTGLTTAAAGTQDLTITNSEISEGSGVLVSISNLGANDAQCYIRRTTTAAGSMVCKMVNGGAASLNGNLVVSFIVLN